jgi:GT2 family glycosyltransferase
MQLSIIIINYNTKEITKNCLISLFKNLKSEKEVIVIDNASNDESVDELKSIFGHTIKLIFNEKNIGFGPANNLGAKLASGKYLLFLNSDTIINNDFTSKLIDFFANNSRAGIVSPELLFENGQSQPHTYGKFPTIFGTITDKFFRPKFNDDSSMEVDWVSGAAMAMRKEVFEKIGGFDENFFMYYEDIDLCKRLKDKGFAIVRLSGLSVTHLVAKSSANAKSIKKMYYRSQNYYFKKHHGYINWILLIMIRLPYRLLKGLREKIYV